MRLGFLAHLLSQTGSVGLEGTDIVSILRELGGLFCVALGPAKDQTLSQPPSSSI